MNVEDTKVSETAIEVVSIWLEKKDDVERGERLVDSPEVTEFGVDDNSNIFRLTEEDSADASLRTELNVDAKRELEVAVARTLNDDKMDDSEAENELDEEDDKVNKLVLEALMYIVLVELAVTVLVVMVLVGQIMDEGVNTRLSAVDVSIWGPLGNAELWMREVVELDNGKVETPDISVKLEALDRLEERGAEVDVEVIEIFDESVAWDELSWLEKANAELDTKMLDKLDERVVLWRLD